MATLAILPPRVVGLAGLDSPTVASYNLAQGAAFREGDFLALITTGTIVTPAPTGALATIAGPAIGQDFNLTSSSSTFTIGNVTVAGSAVSGAPATSYYVIVTYTATGAESLTSQEFIVNCSLGVVPSITVLSANAPSGATNFAVYAGIYSGGEALQQATRTTTALGTAFTLAYPLTNNFGVNRAATNPSANIVGIAMHDSASIYVDGVGGSATANIGSPLGTWANLAPLGPPDPLQALVAKVTNSVPVDIALAQAWYPSLIGSTVGLALDLVSGYWTASTAGSNKVATIVFKDFGVPSLEGVAGDTYARVQIIFTSGVL